MIPSYCQFVSKFFIHLEKQKVTSSKIGVTIYKILHLPKSPPQKSTTSSVAVLNRTRFRRDRHFVWGTSQIFTGQLWPRQNTWNLQILSGMVHKPDRNLGSSDQHHLDVLPEILGVRPHTAGCRGATATSRVSFQDTRSMPMAPGKKTGHLASLQCEAFQPKWLTCAQNRE